jgi:predicted enzyme related to lactoylglutathione lyase
VTAAASEFEVGERFGMTGGDFVAPRASTGVRLSMTRISTRGDGVVGGRSVGGGRPNRAESLSVSVTETFFSVDVKDMQRATALYVHALGATVVFSSVGWSSLRIAGVRVGLTLSPEHVASRVGLHFAVSDLTIARAEVERAGGFASSPVEVAPGVVIVRCDDSEGNSFTLTQSQHSFPRDGYTDP